MKQGDELKRALLTAPVQVAPDLITAYRTVPLGALRKYSSDPLNTAGSKVTGGRYNAPEFLPGSFEMLYVAENLAVAQAEARTITAVTMSGGVVITPGKGFAPRLDITVHLRLHSLLDLTDHLVLGQLDLEPGDLLTEWFPVNNIHGQLATTQLLARAALDSARYEALVYPSARFPGGRNYAVFPDRVLPENRRIYDPEDELAVFRRPQG